MELTNLDLPELYINRELSWLEFNQRVLDEACSEELPLLERLKFASIVSSNLDEFFMIRVAGLSQQKSADIRKEGISGMTPIKQLKKISQRSHKMIDDLYDTIKDICCRLKNHNLAITSSKEWTLSQQEYLKQYFIDEIMPILTPLKFQDRKDLPILPGRELNIIIKMLSVDNIQKTVIIPVPSILQRIIQLPANEGAAYAFIEDVICEYIKIIYPSEKFISVDIFRVLRDADISIQDDEAGDLTEVIEKAAIQRRKRAVVRLDINFGCNPDAIDLLCNIFNINYEQVYFIHGMIDASVLMKIVFCTGFDELKIKEWIPQKPIELVENEDIFDTLSQRDILLSHPYESFDPVIDILEQAADDSKVLAIKQTLYRTSADSPIISALKKAALNGKHITVLVELKARFDESRNVQWARLLEDAGCYVIYGIVGYKTHSKAMLIIRRENEGIKKYVHLSTGNYNEKTAKLYSDIGLLTSNNDITQDVSSFFNLLTGDSEITILKKLTIAPTGLKKKFLNLIEREIRAATPDRPGLIMAKMNSLQDKDICKALYRASQAGVKIMLNVRGICCLRPQVKGISDNITVISIVDRFLEHSRIFYFSYAGHDEIFLSSADWMERNLQKRFEILFPIISQSHKKRLISILQTYFKDNVKSKMLCSDGSYKPYLRNLKRKIRAQQHQYLQTAEKIRNQRNTNLKFKPITSPEQ